MSTMAVAEATPWVTAYTHRLHADNTPPDQIHAYLRPRGSRQTCVPVAGTYVPETGTPPPFPNGMELEDAR